MQLIAHKNKSRSFFLAVAALVTAVGLAGCPSTPETTAPVTDRTTPTAGNTLPQGTGGTTAPVTSVGTVGTPLGAGGLDPALTDPNNPLSKRSIFYDYDSFSVKDEYKPLVNAHAAYLKRNPNMRIVVEGNTDERGSREYNLALGQKRSEGVRRVFTLLGVSEAQIQTVSFGEEKPRNASSNEAAFAENRRCDIRYVGE
jgi:peptidoglycan-associated lipoprotein